MKKATKVLIFALLLCLFSAAANHFLLTSGGEVELYELNLPIPSGETIHVYEYRPKAATKATPAPAIIFSHGNDSTLQSHQDWAMEWSRRGFDVFALDITSAGMSSPVKDPDTVGYGLYDLVEYVYGSLDYIDCQRIGIAGFSKGGNNVIDTMNRYGVEQREDPDYVRRVHAALIADPRFVSMADFATGIHLGFAVGDRSPYANNFTPVEGYLPGDLSVKPEIKELINLRVPGTFTEDELTDPNVAIEMGRIYGDLAGGASCIIYNPHNVTHVSAEVKPAMISDCVAYFQTVLGAPQPIPPEESNVLLQVLSAGIGLVGITIMAAALAVRLIDTELFSSLSSKRTDSFAPVLELRTLPRWLLFLLPALAVSLLLPITAVTFGQLTYKLGFLTLPNGSTGLNRWFLNPWQNSLMLWLTLNAVIALAVTALLYWLVHRKNGVVLREIGVSADLVNAGKAILLALVVFTCCYLVVCAAQYILKVDFRLLDLCFPVLTWERLLQCLRYAPFVVFFWCVNSVSMNGFYRIKGMGERSNLALCVFLNAIGLLVVVAVNYTLLFRTGRGLGNHMRWKYYYACLLFLYSAVAGTVINRILYRKTHNVFVGPVVYGTLATIFSTACMMVPDYIY